MSRKHFSWLFLLTLAVALIVLLVPGKTGRESTLENGELLPGLAMVVNDIDHVRLTAGGGEVIATLERRDESWRVTEAHGYPADWTRLKTLLSELSLARVVEEKTSNPAYYSRLGVEDVNLDGAGGALISFAEGSGLPAVIVGNAATSRNGQYVRLANASRSALIDRKISVPTERMEWLKREIIDVADSEVVEVSIQHPDGEQLVALKASADDTDFSLQQVPQGREIKSNWTVNSIAGSLSGLDLDEVVPDTEFDWAEATTFTLLTADGLQVTVKLLEQDDSHWLRLSSGAHPQAAGEEATNEYTEEEMDLAAAAELDARINRINDRVSGWAYRISRNKYEAMTKRMNDLLQSEETS